MSPIAIYLLLSPLALQAGRSRPSALGLLDWAITAHPQSFEDIRQEWRDVVWKEGGGKRLLA